MNVASHRDAFTGALLIASLVLLILGLVFPAFTVEKFWIFDNQKSIAGAVVALISGKDFLLGIVILLFSIAFPLSKLVLSLWIWASPDPRGRTTRHALKWAVRLGKWSMMDVFLVALVVAMLSLGMVATVTAETGVYFFCAAILIGMWGSHRLHHRVEQSSPSS
ncbi:MAG: paraquat-inducible protein A [Alphaproteobacteria bacterium]